MGKGFFASSTLIAKQPARRVPACGACGLYRTCQSPKMAPTGRGKRKILIVAEAPGQEEDQQGKQLVGNSGRYLVKALARHGIDMRQDCVLTNSLICRPPKNATPDSNQIDYCRPNLLKTIEDYQPEVIVPIGASAVKSLIGHVWREDTGAIGRWVGWKIPSQKPNAWICPTFHPAFLLRLEKDAMRKATELTFHQHLEQIAEIDGRPWDVVPDYEAEVQPIFKPGEAARAIRGFIERGKLAAFDYESNMLKPDFEGSQIVSCSISDGKETIAYPWQGAAIEATREFLVSPVGKVASNLKFEERWTMHHLRTRVKNWRWDTMLAAHALDNRSDITSIKFQAYVHLGAKSYDDHISQFLQSKGDSRVNQILKEIDLRQLLIYNGLDSLLELKVAKIQAKQMGVKL